MDKSREMTKKKKMMTAKLLITIIVLLMFSLSTARATLATEEEAPIGKPGCQTLCGDVNIPFPFGIGATHCYIDKWFEIVCTNSTNTLHTPFLKRTNLEVVDISIDEAMVTVRIPKAFSNCKGKYNRIRDQQLDMTENPFVFSAKRNMFVAASCGYLALLTSNSSTDRDISYGSVVAGCKSTCFGPNSTDDNMYGAKGILDNVCRGIHCCQTTIPSHVKDFEISFHNLEIVDRENKCNYAFLVDQYKVKSGYHEFMSFDEVDDYVPVTMEWYLKYSEFQFFGKRLRNDSANHCPLRIQFGEPDQNTMKCFCKSGFRGNPYVLDGCRDINECENYKMQCGSRICVNKIGRFECIEPISKLVLIGTIGALGAFVLLVVGAYGLYKAIKNRKDAKRKQKLFKQNGGLLLQKCLSSGEANVEKTRVFNSNELDKATDHFSVNRIVGQGGHGTVYKGMLADGRIVAIKKSKRQDQEKKVTEFINEVVILSQINHRNVVKLLGCCLETEVPLLVYEFIPNGTLFEYLHNQNEEIIPLTWKLRLQIAVEIAGALSYLHSAASIPIYHRDIKSTNILLDEKYRAKIADFGTSRSVAIDQTHLTTLIYGTFGYLDPEYFQSSKFSDKSDVYSFGVVIAELLTGQKPVSLAAYFIQCIEDNRLLDSIDGRIVGNYQDIMAVANLAKGCLNSVGKNRPTMKQVAMELETIQRLVN